MAMTETRPESAETAPPDSTAAAATARPRVTGLAGVLGSGSHRTIGKLYIAASLLFLLVAGVAGAAVGIERVDTSSVGVFDQATDAAQVLTLHSVAGVFLFLLPLVLGIAIVVVPSQVGAPTVAFPRAAAASFWAFLVSGGIVLAAYAINGGPYGGDADGVDLFLIAFGGVIVALLLATVCVVTTALAVRAPGMTLERVPMFSWSMVVAGGIWLFTLPVLLADLTLFYVDHHYGRVLFGGNFGIYPRIAWAFGQPQVYAFAIPALGIIGDIVPTFARDRQRSRGVVMALIGAAGVLGIGAYAQSAVAPKVTQEVLWVGMAVAAVIPVLLLAALWADTLRRGTVQLASPLLFATAALLMLLFGAVVGAIGSIPAFDLRIEDGVRTTWDAGQAHYVVLAAAIAVMGALHYWAPVLWRRTLREGGGRIAALLLLLGTVALALPDIYSGALDEASFDQGGTVVRDGVEALNAISLAGGALVLLGVLVFVVNLVASLGPTRAGDGEGGTKPYDPWDGQTLEWAPAEGELPVVTSATPLLDARATTTAEGA